MAVLKRNEFACFAIISESTKNKHIYFITSLSKNFYSKVLLYTNDSLCININAITEIYLEPRKIRTRDVGC